MMRHRSGAGGKSAAVWLAVLAVTGVLAAQVAPVAAQTAQRTVPAQEPLSDDSSAATDLFTSLAEGAAGQVGGAAAGWALSAMGLSSGDSAGLASINSDLQMIITQLSQIEQELTQLTTAIQQLDCDALSSDTLQARTVIDSLASTYHDFADDGAGTYTSPSVPPIGNMENWANSVVDPTAGVLPAILTINNALLPAGSAQGIITACLQPGIVPPPAAGTIGDTAYYDQVANLVNFYYTYEARGLLLLQEAYHFQAQQATGQTLPPDQVGDVCTMATDPSAVLACTSANDDTNTVYERLAAQFQVAGLPYTDDDVILMSNGGTSPPLFARSLEKFTQAAGDNCPTPLTAADPCGVTVATGATVTDPMHVDYDGYTTWTAATKGNLENLIQNRGSKTPGVYMNDAGFANATDKIVLTPQTEAFDLQDDLDGTEICFLHTDLQVFCGNKGVNQDLLETYSKAGDYPCPDYPYWRTKASLPTNVNGFFTADTHTKVFDVLLCKWEWTTEPGWLQGNKGLNAQQYRWPLLNVADLTCTNGRSPTNPGGVPTRCGADFDTMFDTLVTRPVTCMGTTYGLCGDAVDVALTGPQSGEWSSPVLSGDVTVTFHGGVARRITGTVNLRSTDGKGTAAVGFNIGQVGGRHKSYIGIVTIKAEGDRLIVVPIWNPDVDQHADGTVTGKQVWRIGRLGTYTLTWSVRDARLT